MRRQLDKEFDLEALTEVCRSHRWDDPVNRTPDGRYVLLWLDEGESRKEVFSTLDETYVFLNGMAAGLENQSPFVETLTAAEWAGKGSPCRHCGHTECVCP